MRPEVLLSILNALGVHLAVEGGKLLYEGLSVTPLLQKEIEKNEEALKRLLRRPARARPKKSSVESSSIRFHRGVSWTKSKPTPWPQEKNESFRKAWAQKPSSELPQKVGELSSVAVLAEGKPFFPLAWWLRGVSILEFLKLGPEFRKFPIYEVRDREVVLVYDPQKVGSCPKGVEHPHRCKLGELVEAPERVSGYEWRCRGLKAPCPAIWQPFKEVGQGGAVGGPVEKEDPPENGPDEEARELAEKLRRLLEPETLERLKAMAPIRETRWERVLEPEKFMRRTLFELETGRSWLLEAAKERARRFLEAVEPHLKTKGPT